MACTTQAFKLRPIDIYLQSSSLLSPSVISLLIALTVSLLTSLSPFSHARKNGCIQPFGPYAARPTVNTYLTLYKLVLISHSVFEGETIHITVVDGEESTFYYVPKRLLQQKSRYFTVLEHFENGEMNHVVLRNVNLNAFRSIVLWLYMGKIEKTSGSGLHDNYGSSSNLIHLWATADRLQFNECKNITMDTLRSWYQFYDICPLDLKLADNLGYTEDSPLVRCIIEQVSWYMARKNVLQDPTSEEGSKLSWVAVRRNADDDKCYAESTSTVRSATRSACEAALQDMELAWRMAKEVLDQRPKVPRSKFDRKSMKMEDPTPKHPSYSRRGCIYHEHLEGEKCHFRREEKE